MSKVKCWTCDPQTGDAAKLLRLHKYKDLAKVRPVILKAAQRAIAEGAELADPKAYFSINPIDELTHNSLSVGEQVFHCDAFDKLAGCNQLVSFVVTLGDSLDHEISAGFDDGTDPLAPLFLDTAGRLIIEATTRAFSSFLKSEQFGPTFRFSPRMAPGYDYPIHGRAERAMWDLSEQAKLFALLASDDMPVTLLESGAMMPRMSRSGIYAIRPQN